MEKENTISGEAANTQSTVPSAESRSKKKTLLKEEFNYMIHMHTRLHILQWNHFMCVGFIWSVPLLFIVNNIHLVLRFGLPPVLISYFIISAVFGIPLIMAYLFFGSYTRKGYIVLWEMVPALKGFSWGAGLFSITVELFNVTLTGIALLYILKLFSFKIPWENCKFEGASKLCRRMDTTKAFTKTCCIYNNKNCSKEMQENYVHFPALEYFYNSIIKIPRVDTGKEQIHVPLLLAVCFIWFLILLGMVFGFQNFIGFITSIFTALAYFCIVISIGLLIFIGNTLPSFSISNSDFSVMLNLEFWINIIAHCALNIIPSNFVILGAIAPLKVVPIPQAIKISAIQYISMILFSSWLSISIQMLSKYYQVTDIKCIKVDGILFLFAIIPDILTRSNLARLLLFIWFFSICLLGFSSSLCTMSAFLESLEQASPKIIKVRIYFCAILCIILLSINIFLLTNLFLRTFETWNLIVFIQVPLILIFIFCIGLLLYSITNYNNDYYFTYGKPLTAYWIQSYKLILLISSLSILSFGFSIIPVKSQLHPKSKIFFPKIYTLVILTPILIIAIVTYFMYKNRNEALLAVTPTIKWGPPSLSRKQARIRFNPDKYSSLKDMDNICLHSCLLNSHTYKKEMKLLSLNCSHLNEIYFEEKFN